MRPAALGLFLFLILSRAMLAEETTTPTLSFHSESPAEPQVKALHEAWLKEKAPKARAALGEELVQAVIHEYDNPEVPLVDEVTRDGVPQKTLLAPPLRKVKLQAITVLKGAHLSDDCYPARPVMRRVSAHRIELWTDQNGWLFDARGKTVAAVKIPRRDGRGRDWFGAFLPDGTWITTDLWDGDKQLNCFGGDGTWKWELMGSSVLAQLPVEKPGPDEQPETVYPSFGWARAHRTGRMWLVSLGTEFSRASAFVTPAGRVIPLAKEEGLWSSVQPRSMGVRGFYIDLFIESDDRKAMLSRSSAGHGLYVGWPRYNLPGREETVVWEGNDTFGFWPDSHAMFIGGGAFGGADVRAKRTWFFDEKGRYEGETAGTYLSDAAQRRDLLILDEDNRVAQVSRGVKGAAIQHMRSFQWRDGSPAIPLAIYDDLRLGFFLRGLGIQGKDDEGSRARGEAEVVLARW